MLHKFNHTFVGRTVSILLAFAMLSSAIGNPVIAQDIPQTENQPRAYLVVVSLPELATLELPKFKDREEAQKYSGSLMSQRVRQTLTELRRLQEGGLIQEVELANDGQSIRIQGVAEIAFPMIEKIGTVDAILDDTGEIGPCLTNAAEVFPERLWGLSQAQIAHSKALDNTNLDVAAPKIEIYYYRYNEVEDWTIYSTVTPNIEVKLEIWRNGSLVAYDYRFSDADGWVYFYPNYQTCPSEHYSWQLISGDTVKVIAAGQTSQTTYAPISGWANPDTNMIFGTTLPGRTVRATISQRDTLQPCIFNEFYKEGTADSNGNFSIDTTSVIDFTQFGGTWLESIDANGNLIYSYAHTYYFRVMDGSDFYYLYHQPFKNYTVTLKRGTVVISSQTATTDERGYSHGSWPVVAQAGDIATLTIGADTFTRTVFAISLPEVTSFDPATGILNGAGLAGQRVFVEGYNSSSVASATCGYYSRCLSATVDGTGHFSFNLGPIYESERVYLSAIFQDGSTRGISVYSKPVIAAYPDWHSVYFDDYFSADPTVTLKTSGGAVKEIVTAVMYFWYWGYNARFSVDMIPGDIIEITDGTRNETMVVGDLQDLRLNFNTNQLTGKGTGKRVIAEIIGYGGDSYYYCVENNLGSNTTFDFAIPTVNAGYYASVDLIGSDGHFTHTYTHSLDLNVWVNSTSLRGNTETPGATVNWELWRGGGLIDSGSAPDYPSSTYFDVWYNILPVAGDELRVSTSDGNTASIIYPTITAQADFTARAVSGKAIANRRGLTNFYRHTPDSYYQYSIPWYADTGGNYLAHMPQEMYWGMDCSSVNVSYPCSPLGAYSWTVDNFWTINLPGWPDSSAIQADTFESDNTKETAATISGVQSHTLHTYSDEDWVKITVTQEDVDHAHVFLFRTFDLGLDFDLIMELRAPDGTTKIAEAGAENWDGSGLGPELQYIFATPGTYYLRLHSMGSDWDGGYCDSKYSLFIMVDPKFVFLPLIKR